MNESDRVWCDFQVNSIHRENIHGPTLLRHLHTSLEKAEAIVKGCEAFGLVRLYRLDGKSFVVRVEFL